MKMFHFFKQGLTVVEKWILYNNVELKRLWSNQKQQSVIIAMADLYPNEVMPCIWWDLKEVLCEFLQRNKCEN